MYQSSPLSQKDKTFLITDTQDGFHGSKLVTYEYNKRFNKCSAKHRNYGQTFTNMHFRSVSLRTKIILSHAVFNGYGTWFSNYEKNTV